MRIEDDVRRYVRCVLESTHTGKVRSSKRRAKDLVNTARDEFIGLLPPDVMVDPVTDEEGVVVTFDPPSALGDGKFGAAQTALMDEVTSVLEQLGFTMTQSAPYMCHRDGVDAIALPTTLNSDARYVRHRDYRQTPACEVQFTVEGVS